MSEQIKAKGICYHPVESFSFDIFIRFNEESLKYNGFDLQQLGEIKKVEYCPIQWHGEESYKAGWNQGLTIEFLESCVVLGQYCYTSRYGQMQLFDASFNDDRVRELERSKILFAQSYQLSNGRKINQKMHGFDSSASYLRLKALHPKLDLVSQEEVMSRCANSNGATHIPIYWNY